MGIKNITAVYIFILFISFFMSAFKDNYIYVHWLDDDISNFEPKKALDYKAKIRVGVCHGVDIDSQQFKDNCVGSENRKLVLWGDSFAASLYPGLSVISKQKKINVDIIQLTDFNAPPFFDANNKANNGSTLEFINQKKLAYVGHLQPEIVLFAWMYNGKNGGNNERNLSIIQTIDALRRVSPSTKIIVLGPFPIWVPTLIHIFKKYGAKNINKYEDRGLHKGLLIRDRFFSSYIWPEDITYLSVFSTFCRNEKCLTSVDGSVQTITTVDFGHLSHPAAKYFISKNLKAIWGAN